MMRPPTGERGRCKVEAVGRKRKSHTQNNGGFSFIFTFPQESVFTCFKIVYTESISAKLKCKQSIKQLDTKVFFFHIQPRVSDPCACKSIQKPSLTLIGNTRIGVLST